MRVAVVMSGHLRGVAALMDQQVRILDGCRRTNEVDLFVHTWSDGDGGDSIRQARDAHELLAPLRPVAVHVDHPVETEQAAMLRPGFEGLERDGMIADRLASMWGGIKRGFAMAKEQELRSGFEYDLFVRTRPDVLWDAASELRLADNGLARFPRRHAAATEPSDLAFIIPRADANRVFLFRSNLEAIAEPYQEYGYPTIVPEYALGYYLRSMAIRWEAFQSDVVLLRQNGDELWFDQDQESFAYKSGKGVHASMGDGLSYAAGGPNDGERVTQDILENIRPSDEIDRRVAVDGPRLLDLSLTSPQLAMSMILSATEASSSWLTKVYLASMLVIAYKRPSASWGSSKQTATVKIFARAPVRAARILVTLLVLAAKRALRRRRTAAAVGMSRHIRAPLSRLTKKNTTTS